MSRPPMYVLKSGESLSSYVKRTNCCNFVKVVRLIWKRPELTTDEALEIVLEEEKKHPSPVRLNNIIQSKRKRLNLPPKIRHQKNTNSKKKRKTKPIDPTGYYGICKSFHAATHVVTTEAKKKGISREEGLCNFIDRQERKKKKPRGKGKLRSWAARRRKSDERRKKNFRKYISIKRDLEEIAYLEKLEAELGINNINDKELLMNEDRLESIKPKTRDFIEVSDLSCEYINDDVIENDDEK